MWGKTLENFRQRSYTMITSILIDAFVKIPANIAYWY